MSEKAIKTLEHIVELDKACDDIIASYPNSPLRQIDACRELTDFAMPKAVCMARALLLLWPALEGLSEYVAATPAVVKTIKAFAEAQEELEKL